eukprot:3941935-Rhodomonas_salina.4
MEISEDQACLQPSDLKKNLTDTLGELLTVDGAQQYTGILIWSTQLKTPPLECEFVFRRRGQFEGGGGAPGRLSLSVPTAPRTSNTDSLEASAKEPPASDKESAIPSTVNAIVVKALAVGNRRRLLQNSTIPDYTVDIRVSIDFAPEFAEQAGEIIRGLSQFSIIILVDFDSVQVLNATLRCAMSGTDIAHGDARS